MNVRQKHWMQWLAIWLALVVIGGGIGYLLIAQGLTTAGGVALAATAIAAYLWLVGGVFAGAQPRYLLWTLLHLGVGIIGALIAWSFRAMDAPVAGLVALGIAVLSRSVVVYRAYRTSLSWCPTAVGLLAFVDVGLLCYQCWQFGYRAAAIVIAGAACMALMFLAGLWLIRALLSPGWPMLAVARTLIYEAMRIRIALVFIVLIMLIVPILPHLNDPTEWLKYRIGTFLSWSLGSTSLLLGLMTIFLACGTICGEVRFQQIHLTMTKPIRRAHYLLGKWVGIALLDLLLLAVAGGGIYTFARMMQQLPARDADDRRAVTEEVLVARASMLPKLPAGQDFNELVDQQMALIAKQGHYDQTHRDDKTSRQEARNQVVYRWHTVGRFNQQSYVFTGLEKVRGLVDTVQLKVKPSAEDLPGTQKVRFTMEVNGRPYPLTKPLLLNIVQVIPIPAIWIDELGRLEIVIMNVHPDGQQHTIDSALHFTPDEGFRLLHHYGAFGPNLVRAILMVWVQLCFLAMVALAAGTFVGFPIACMISLMVYVAATASGFLNESVSLYAVSVGEYATAWQTILEYPKALWKHLGDGQYGKAAKVPVQIAGEMFMALVPSFTKYNPTPLIADGQAVRPALLGEAFLMLGLVWTGVTGLIGYLIFRQRELARVTV